jgi:hypothetical protein
MARRNAAPITSPPPAWIDDLGVSKHMKTALRLYHVSLQAEAVAMSARTALADATTKVPDDELSAFADLCDVLENPEQ